ncbi:hypothetical protein TrRE_jg10134 [Triparma retinervis]|uniref:Uncharacterized protein n=1 Tax=Triparma retinervis TaxID=2557542 RepID=A0A9W7FWM9_9STRA|nr:hypothetical protein TrRE_jg10134 [Triparma retinervis]
MQGRWEDLKKFLGPMKRSNFDYDRSLFLVDKQIFLEMLDAQTSPFSSTSTTPPPPSSEQLVAVLKELEGRCSQEEFHGLCFCLTVKSLSNHPEYKDWTVYGGRSELFEKLLVHLSSVFPDQVARRGRAKDMPDNHLVKLMQLAVMQQIQEHKYHNPNSRVPEDFFANILADVFTYQKNTASSQGEGRGGGVFSVSQSVPDAKGMCEWVLDPAAERKGPVVPLGGEGKEAGDKREGGGGEKKVVGKIVEEAQGFYSMVGGEGGEEEVNERFDPPMEVTHFPPQPVEKRPPQAWEIKWNEEEEGEAEGGEAEEGRKKREAKGEKKGGEAAADDKKQVDEEKGEKEEKEEKEEPPPAIKFPPLNPEDPYGHVTTADAFSTLTCLATLQESHPIRTCSFNPSGSVFAVGTNSKALRLCAFDEERGEIDIIHERSNHHLGSVYCSSWNCEGKLIATGSNDKTVKVVKVFLEENDDLPIISNSIERNDLVLKGHGGTVRDVMFHNEDHGRLLSVGAGEKPVGLVWDIVGVGGAEISPIRTLEGHSQAVYCGRFSPFDTHFVATGSADNTVKLWDLRSDTSKGASMSINCTSPVFSCCFKGKHELVTSHSDGTIRSVDIKTGKTTSVIQAHNDECRSLDVTPCRRFMLSGGFDGTAGVFGLDESQKNDQPEFKAKVRHKGGGRVLSAKWRPRGDVGLLLSGADCSVQFWGRKEAVGVGAGVAK